MRCLLFSCLLFLVFPAFAQQAPSNFREAKILSKKFVYYDQNQSTTGDIYCGCSWTWVGESGGLMNLKSCGYQPRKDAQRAQRMEWEHILPANIFGKQRQCWQQGGRQNCTQNDPVFSRMEGDMFNLYPSVGEVNADRSNFLYGMALSTETQYGQCSTKIDFSNRTAEPRSLMKGLTARTTFYMYDKYGLRMSPQQEKILMAWDHSFPVSPWEKERDNRISRIMGWHNPFVTGEKHWTTGYNTSSSHSNPISTPLMMPISQPVQRPDTQPKIYLSSLVGNASSKIYHIQGKCPNFSDVSPQNRVYFSSEQQAIQMGFRKAKNCQP